MRTSLLSALLVLSLGCILEAKAGFEFPAKGHPCCHRVIYFACCSPATATCSGSPVQDASDPPKPRSSRLQQLLETRRDTLKKLFEGKQANPTGTSKDVIAAAKWLLEAELSLAETREARADALKAALATMTRLEEGARMQRDRGFGNRTDHVRATSERQAVAIRLAEEQQRPVEEVNAIIERRLATLARLTRMWAAREIGGFADASRVDEAYMDLAEMKLKQASIEAERVAVRREILKRSQSIEKKVRGTGTASGSRLPLAVSNRLQAEIELASEENAGPQVIARLRKKRREALKRRMSLLEQEGFNTLPQQYETMIAIWSADAEQAQSKPERLALLRKIHELRKSVEKEAQAKVRVGFSDRTELLQATGKRLDAEIDLVKAELSR